MPNKEQTTGESNISMIRPRFSRFLVRWVQTNGAKILYSYPPKGGGGNSGGYKLRREASRYISTALHRP